MIVRRMFRARQLPSAPVSVTPWSGNCPAGSWTAVPRVEANGPAWDGLRVADYPLMR
jgi:hypothetical protein